MMCLNIFKNLIKVKSVLPAQFRDLSAYILRNRETLNLVENWIDEKAFSASIFKYGVPDYIKTEINKKINNEITYSDLITFISSFYFENLNYLEIGVSVGKNFLQILNGTDNLNEAYGFDIEEINPILEKKFISVKKKTWNTLESSIKKSESSLSEYTYKEKIVKYLSADVWDEESWKKLENKKFSVIFSDALHTPEAILFEFEMIIKHNLLNDNFVIVWDDLEGRMAEAFFEIIKKYNKKVKIKDVYLLNVNGWVGEHERKHSIGIISNLKF